jgi:Family of unknown function (DUF6499)
MPHADWRSPATYEGLRSLDAPGFAWEFLTRNAAFERDFERLEQASENGPLSADELTDFARRWGVRFCQARAWRRRSQTAMDAGKPAERDLDHSASN